MAVSVLIVDDEPCVRAILACWLAAEGYACGEAEDGPSAWAYLKAHDVSLVTLDVRMPGGSGMELLPRIKERYPDTAVIMVTGQGETRTAIDALTQGAWGYLVKPVGRDELLFQVDSALKRRELVIGRRQYTKHLERRVREQTLEIRQAHEETIHRLLGASMYRDEETGAHIKRTGLCSQILAGKAGWSTEQAELLRLAAPMHDVGKIGIPDAILQKPGKLTPEQFETMKGHTVIGARILAGSAVPMLQMAEEIALCHHERWDGTGYPRGLSGEEIPESARIVALVDVYDALTHDRVYRPAMTQEEAMGIIDRGLGTHFDPLLGNLFFCVLPEIMRISQENPDDQTRRERFAHPASGPPPWEVALPGDPVTVSAPLPLA